MNLCIYFSRVQLYLDHCHQYCNDYHLMTLRRRWPLTYNLALLYVLYNASLTLQRLATLASFSNILCIRYTDLYRSTIQQRYFDTYLLTHL